jgi:hypothetical protein
MSKNVRYDVFGQMAEEYSLGAQSPLCTTCYMATHHPGSMGRLPAIERIA